MTVKKPKLKRFKQFQVVVIRGIELPSGLGVIEKVLHDLEYDVDVELSTGIFTNRYTHGNLRSLTKKETGR